MTEAFLGEHLIRVAFGLPGTGRTPHERYPPAGGLVLRRCLLGKPWPGRMGLGRGPDGEPHGCGGEPATTNQRMELRAALEALRLGVGSEAGPSSWFPIDVRLNCFRDVGVREVGATVAQLEE